MEPLKIVFISATPIAPRVEEVSSLLQQVQIKSAYSIPSLKLLALREFLVVHRRKIYTLPKDIQELRANILTCCYCCRLRVRGECCRCQCGTSVLCISANELDIKLEAYDMTTSQTGACQHRVIRALQQHSGNVTRASTQILLENSRNQNK
jgi:hypothetical protein